MKRLLFVGVLLLCTLNMSSCYQAVAPKEPQDYPIESFYKAFAEDNPTWYQNDVMKEEASKAFEKAFLDTLKVKNLLSGIPLRMSQSCEYSKGKYAIDLQGWIKPSGFRYRQGVGKINVDVVGLVSKEVIEGLVDDEYYSIHGSFKKKLTMNEFQKYIKKGYVVTPRIYLSREYDETTLELGLLLFDIDSVSVFSGREFK